MSCASWSSCVMESWLHQLGTLGKPLLIESSASAAHIDDLNTFDDYLVCFPYNYGWVLLKSPRRLRLCWRASARHSRSSSAASRRILVSGLVRRRSSRRQAVRFDRQSASIGRASAGIGRGSPSFRGGSPSSATGWSKVNIVSGSRPWSQCSTRRAPCRAHEDN